MPSNWGLTQHELETIPPSLVRGFAKGGLDGFGSELPNKFGRLLMRDEYNSELYGPLQEEYLHGKEAGTDVLIHKNRYGAAWLPEYINPTITESTFLCQDKRAVGLSKCAGLISSGEWHHNTLVWRCERGSGIFQPCEIRSTS